MMCFCEFCLRTLLCVYSGMKAKGRPNDRVAHAHWFLFNYETISNSNIIVPHHKEMMNRTCHENMN